MDWRKIPSLSGLRAYEAAARLKNFSAAARELNVTDAAIRQHIRNLEVFFEQSLVVRSGRGIALTKSGAALAETVTSGFQTLQSGIKNLQNNHADRPIKIALTPAFAENWLMPRLGEFWAQHPEIEIELAPSLKVIDIETGGFDLAIRYGYGHWEGYESEFLASAQYVVVAAVNFATNIRDRSLDNLRSLTWLFEASRTEHQQWASEHDINFSSDKNKFYPTNSLVLSAVKAGYGLSLQAFALVESDIQNGNLVEIYSEDSGDLGYYLVVQSNPRKKLVTFLNWLKVHASI